MKIGIYSGEAFPIYEIHYDGFDEIEVDADTLQRWKTAFDQFSAIQKEITEQLRKQGFADNIWFQGIWNGFKIYEKDLE